MTTPAATFLSRFCRTIFPSIAALFFYAFPQPTLDRDFWESYQRLLNQSVLLWQYESVSGTFAVSAVDYARIKKNPDILKLVDLQKEKLARAGQVFGNGLFDSAARTQRKKAFWLNAANFFLLAEVLERTPRTNSQEIAWKTGRFAVGGRDELLSLDQILQDLLRPMNDPRLHFAFHTAAVSGPPLTREIYDPENLEKQLQKAVENALRNPLRLRFGKSEGGALSLRGTPLFLWYETDFKVDPYGSAIEFIRVFGPDLRLDKAPFFADLPYDWDLDSPQNVTARMDELAIHHPELRIKKK
ncbi:MAG: DUF547 domain-containing protein [Spirochaetia bacterium]|nr:DUF547 domain-containing protein [Spirochaetia bacterium]